MCQVPCLLVSLLVLNSISSTAIQSVPPQTTAPTPEVSIILRQSIAAMGGTFPMDSSASGAVTITAGSETQEGTITIATRGSSQTLEQLIGGTGAKTVIFSNGLAAETDNLGGKKVYSLELGASTQSALFPLPLFSAILSFTDSMYEYVALESIGGIDCHHIRTWRTFNSKPEFGYLAPFSMRDIWISTATNLPAKIAYSIRSGRGAEPSTAVEVSYSKYQQIAGIQYPFVISQSLNGTPWMTISISSVSFNTGLSDSTFSVQ
jgi:hypothetical protein